MTTDLNDLARRCEEGSGGDREPSFWETRREIPHLEAEAVAIRLINSMFRNDAERARVSIPANPDRDDDLLIRSYIRQQMRKEARALAHKDLSHDE